MAHVGVSEPLTIVCLLVDQALKFVPLELGAGCGTVYIMLS